MPLSRCEELRMIQEFIETHGVTVLEPFEVGMVRKKWRLRGVRIGVGEKGSKGDT